MTPEKFVDDYMNGGYDIDGAYGRQCVDLFKIFCNDNWGTYTACPSGYADSYFTDYDNEPFIIEHFQKIEGTDFKNGDWVVFSTGSQTAPNSHICMYYNGQAFGTNQYGNRNAANLIDIDWSQAAGALRPIGVWDEEPTAQGCSLHAGTLRCIVDRVHVRTAPSLDAEIRTNYDFGMTVNILDIVHAEGYYWGHYVSWSGIDSYTALQEDSGVCYWENV